MQSTAESIFRFEFNAMRTMRFELTLSMRTETAFNVFFVSNLEPGNCRLGAIVAWRDFFPMFNFQNSDYQNSILDFNIGQAIDERIWFYDHQLAHGERQAPINVE